MKLYIKYMVSLRCKMLVQEELKKLGLQHVVLEFGTVEILEDITKKQRERLKASLLRSGWELLDSKKGMLIEKVKNLITEMVHHSDEMPKVIHSEYFSKQLGQQYSYLANIFAEVQGITIQQYIILEKAERIKELLLYNDLNLKQISYLMHYSSVAHLSNQFKKVTGLSPSYYKQLKRKRKGKAEKL